MKAQFKLYRRGRIFYCEDPVTGEQVSLRTADRGEAETLVHARNEAHRQPMLNLQIARTYLRATDPEIATRSWQVAMDEMAKGKTGPTLARHLSAMREHAFDAIRAKPILETQPADLLRSSARERAQSAQISRVDSAPHATTKPAVYPINRYVDPNDPNVMHEGHVVYRREATGGWNLSPNAPTVVPLGPALAVADPAKQPNPLPPELEQKMAVVRPPSTFSVPPAS